MTNIPLIDVFKKAGQGHVFRFWEELPTESKERLLEQAGEIDLGEIERLTGTLLKGGGAGVDVSGLEPAGFEALPEKGGDAGLWRKAREVGEEALRAGRVAAFTVAGGQGTRLGYEGPKGTFPVTPVKGKSLFQVFAEKIRAVGERYGKEVHWFIMTSHLNHAATEAFFRENGFFGLRAEFVHFFRQGRMPAVGFDGKILLEGKDAIAMSPDGHGGSLRALLRSGALDLMDREGIDVLSYFQVDNPLVQPLDAAFIGWHVMRGSEMSSKMLPKAYPEEKLGHFCVQRGRNVVIEYSDLPKELQAEVVPATGRLRFLAGSIAIHIFDTKFVRRVAAGGSALELPFHRADKKIPFVGTDGTVEKPEQANGVKFEMFVFDALPFAKNPVVIETSREDEFSPVKNAEGVDSPATCRADQMKQFARWLEAGGVAVAEDAEEVPVMRLEVSPLFGYDEESFLKSWQAVVEKPVLRDGFYLE